MSQYIETTTKLEADKAERQYFDAWLKECEALGYTIVTDKDGNKGIVGKNAKTGEDNPDVVTWKWSETPEVNGKFEVTPREGVVLKGVTYNTKIETIRGG